MSFVNCECFAGRFACRAPVSDSLLALNEPPTLQGGGSSELGRPTRSDNLYSATPATLDTVILSPGPHYRRCVPAKIRSVAKVSLGVVLTHISHINPAGLAVISNRTT